MLTDDIAQGHRALVFFLLELEGMRDELHAVHVPVRPPPSAKLADVPSPQNALLRVRPCPQSPRADRARARCAGQSHTPGTT